MAPQKTKLLILGCSYIVKKAVLGAVEKTPGIEIAGIASEHNYEGIPRQFPAFKSYEEGLRESGCNTVYISTRNTSHCGLILKSLERGKNVICDKPAVLNKKQAQECFKKAAGKLIIFESIAYPHHAAHAMLKGLLERQQYPLQKITAHFGFPPLPEKNFRNFARFGGGCIYDIGPYMASAGQLYFGRPAIRAYCESYIPPGSDVPTSASVMLHYGANRVLQGHFGFELEYKNSLELWGMGFSYSLARAFTTPPDLALKISAKEKDTAREIPVPPCDQFGKMLGEYVRIFNSPKKGMPKNRLFLEQAIQLEALAESARKKRIVNISYEGVQ